MRQFVAACCCAIVGLEVLIAVPLVTCLVVLGMIGDVGADYAAATIPPPQYAALPMMPPLPATPTAFGPAPICPSPICTPPICLPPSMCATEPVTAPLAPQVAAIAEVLDHVGSPLASSSLVGDCRATRDETIAALNRVAKEDESPITVSKPEAGHTCPELCPHSCPAHAPETATAEPALDYSVKAADSLQAAADALYVRAQALEIDSHFDRADRLRKLAREIRSEISALRLESPWEPRDPQPSAPQPTPAAVKAASYHAELPKEPAMLRPADAAVLPTPPVPLVTARATLVEQSPVPDLKMQIGPGLIIVEEDDSALGIPLEDPQNPAP